MSSEAESSTQAGSTSLVRAGREARLRTDTVGRRAFYSPGVQRLDREQAQSAPPEADGWAIVALNVSVAILLLALAVPLMALVAIAVRLTSPGPVLYSQVRVGVDRRAGSRPPGHRRRIDLGGRPIQIYKFRTMFFDGGDAGQVWAKPNDRRVTRVGRFLRAYRIDELPQLVSVLRRDMNVVGPRPEQPEIFAQLRERYERFPERQRVLPGITGLAQVKCGYGGDDFQIRRKLQCDLEYVQQRSLWEDLSILIRTIPVVLTRHGAR